MSAVPGRSQASSHRSPQGEGIPVSAVPGKSASTQRGIALLLVLVVLLLASLALLGGLQVAWLSERRVGSESDSQRAFAAAEALMRDAELDILGLSADGPPCALDSATQVGCRAWAGAGPFFPQSDEDLDTLRLRVVRGYRNCLQGICLPDELDALSPSVWATDLDNMTAGEGPEAIAATYGQFTLARPEQDGNPLLSAAEPRAWYWVEVFRYSDAAGILNPTGVLPVPDRRHPFVYRITTYVKGLKPGPRSHLRSVFVPYPRNPP